MTEPSVSFAGNLTDDSELHYTANGAAVANFARPRLPGCTRAIKQASTAGDPPPPAGVAAHHQPASLARSGHRQGPTGQLRWPLADARPAGREPDLAGRRHRVDTAAQPQGSRRSTDTHRSSLHR
jgi:hypothetical protein